MRHRVLGSKLGRDNKQRKALLKNLASSLILHGKIVTTTAKAKMLRPYTEKLITKAKKDASFNTVKYMQDKLDTNEAIKTLLTKVAPTFSARNGGYLRLVKVGNRIGDNTEMSRIEILKEETKTKETKKAPKKDLVSAKTSTTKKPKTVKVSKVAVEPNVKSEVKEEK